MSELKAQAVKDLKASGWTRANIQSALGLKTTDIQAVLGKSTRGRKATVDVTVKAVVKTKRKSAKKAKKK